MLDVLRGAGFVTEVTDDLAALVWRKLEPGASSPCRVRINGL